MAVKVVNLTRIRYFDTEKNKKNLPVRNLISEEESSGSTTSLSLRAGGREKISRKKILVVNDFERLVLKLISREARFRCHKYMGKQLE